MKIKWGMMMTDGRGKLGGQVASKNRAGAYIRTKVTPVNPQTSFQSAVRQRLAVLSARWSNLPESARTSWNEAANSAEWSKNDIFGDARRPTGKNLFTGLNLVSLEVTNTLMSRPPKKANFSPFSISSLDVIANGDVIMFADVRSEPVTDTRWQVEATPPVSSGRYYLKNLYRHIDSTQQVFGDSNELIVSNPYQYRFGELGEDAVGKRVGVRIRQVLDGQVTPWVEVSAIVAPEP